MSVSISFLKKLRINIRDLIFTLARDEEGRVCWSKEEKFLYNHIMGKLEKKIAKEEELKLKYNNEV